MDELIQFHFLRPWCLLLIPALLLLSYWLSQQVSQHTGFEQWIDSQLLRHISTAHQKKRDGFAYKLPYILMAIAWVIVSLALAGPTWKQLPQPLHQSEQAMVVILDLSPSMLAKDNKPSRIVRARLKIQDLLSQRKDGLTALVVYAGEAHIVTPLTDDTRTIINLLSTLTPGLLPIPGSNIEMAIDVSKQLIKDSRLNKASFILVTDGIDNSAISTIKNTLNNDLELYIVGVGTQKGAPIPSSSSDNQTGEFLRDDNNRIITVRRDEHTLKGLAQQVNGHYLPLQANNADVQFILEDMDIANDITNDSSKKIDRNIDQWEEFGPLLLLFSLPLFALIFRRGWLLVGIISINSFMPEPAYALSWDDLWLNKNQQAQRSFQEKNYANAEKQFKDKQWQGSAAYKNKNYQSALDAFSQGDSANDFYNKGNALSQLGQYDEAISAYDTALKKDPSLENAKKNKAFIEKLKQQQEKQNQKDQQQTGENSKEENSDSSEKQKSNDQESSQNQESSKNNAEKEDNSNEENKPEKALNKTEGNKKDGKEGNTLEKDQAMANLSEEEKQELEQWIKKIPDDPSGLLRRKFEYEFQKRRQLYQSGKWKLPDNNAHKRY